MPVSPPVPRTCVILGTEAAATSVHPWVVELDIELQVKWDEMSLEAEHIQASNSGMPELPAFCFEHRLQPMSSVPGKVATRPFRFLCRHLG